MASTNIDIKLAQVDELNINELTTKALDGTGVFDVLMATNALHIQEEYAKNRIRGPEYAQVYIGAMQATLAASVDYLHRSKMLGIEISNHEKQGLLLEAQRDQIIAETTQKLPAEVASIQAGTSLTAANQSKVEEEVKLVPKQGEMLDAQVDQVTKETTLRLPAEVANLTKQGEVLTQQISESEYRIKNLLPKELEQMTAQISNLGKQGTLVEAQASQVTAETTTRLPAEVLSIKANTQLTETNKSKLIEDIKLIPMQGELLTAQTGQVGAETLLTNKQTDRVNAELAKIPVEVELLTKQVTLADSQVLLTAAQITAAELQNTKVPKEIAILEKQALQADAQTALTNAQQEQIVKETTTRLPVEVLNLQKQGSQLEAQTTLTAAQSEQVVEQTKKVPFDIAEIQARIANMTKQNLLLEKDYELRISQLALQEKQLLITEAELDVKRQEIQVQLAAIDSQKAQAQLYAQKVITEKAQTSAAGLEPGSVLGANVAVLVAQAEGYKSDAKQKVTKILVDTWNVRRNSDEGTQATPTNQLHDANVGVAVSGLLRDAGFVPAN